jgi:hypothetical protein
MDQLSPLIFCLSEFKEPKIFVILRYLQPRGTLDIKDGVFRRRKGRRSNKAHEMEILAMALRYIAIFNFICRLARDDPP